MNLVRLGGSAALALLLSTPSAAQTPTPAFALLGPLQQLDVASLNDPLSPGSMTVNGIPVVLPRNLYVTVPDRQRSISRQAPGVVSGPGLSEQAQRAGARGR